ncbi:hypothetical protein F4553_002513 [Allocatelliglobosispora scoriae]|uniref:Uncharacterized protein n=1 Tax=Allocatelliglobosispora scoriae TaxID=643052 RepID=A0A841BLG8_9ACTN|nr:hypothetical protein [Allocatelliglobosispora scoriae]MBB5869134.1 hypothetical protein [Allocatelliglobosispora scoriae]
MTEQPVAARAETTSGELTRHLLLLLANATVITAVLVYFGWRRTEVMADELGIDEAILGMSSSELILRSIDQVQWLLLALGLGGLAWLWLGKRLTRLATGPSAGARLVPWVLVGVAIATPIGMSIAASVLEEPVTFLLAPVTITVGFLLLVFAVRLELLRRDAGSVLPAQAQLFILLVTAVGLFWAASNLATVVGARMADRFVAELPDRVDVTIVSDRPLHLSDGIITETVLGTDVEGLAPVPKQYRYEGLKLMDRIDGNVFLVSSRWRPGDSPVFVLHEGDGIRFSYEKP